MLTTPETEAMRDERDALLTRALRDGGTPFTIADEYPLVLSRAGARFSHCLLDAGKVVAHANLWPRTIGGELPVGLVGNVATDERYRGRGLMTTLLRELEERARGAGLKALLLWSDLEGFYQKQGFRSCGRERRYSFSGADLPRAAGWRRRTDVGREELSTWLAMRPGVVTLERSVDEFAAQLTIPGMAVFSGTDGYLVVGKGCDMQGVAHEWGGNVLSGCGAACDVLGMAEILVLSPVALAGSYEEHPMCWAKTIENIDKKEEALLEQCFVWGLDSI